MPGPEERDQEEQRNNQERRRKYEDTEEGLNNHRLSVISRIRFIHERIKTHAEKPLELEIVQNLLTESVEWPKRFESSLSGLFRVVSDNDRRRVYTEETNEFYEEAIDTSTALAKLEKKLKPTSNPQTNPNGNSSNRETVVKLPRLDLPTFDGEILQWKIFLDMFNASIHNNQNLSKIQKFTYLKAALSGEAEASIADLTLSDANYDVAIKTLTDRYENPRRIKLAVVHDFLSYKQSNGADGLRGLIDKTNQLQRIFQSLKMTEKDTLDALLIYIIQEKMDGDAKQQWRLTWTGKDLATLDSLKEFLAEHAERRIAQHDEDRRCLHKDVANRPSDSQGGRRSSEWTCRVGCTDSEFHKLERCDYFMGLSIEERYDVIRKSNLCSNCLGVGHSKSECRLQPVCGKCGGAHNALLHQESEQELDRQ